ncbi:MAG: hypothetical protein EBS36_03870 [Actinobacteria bacterium]|nr:hypothetical protein [Actinomycetota bacterium]NBY15693.1 hypothetical protein [Actinomycetota bacterium]
MPAWEAFSFAFGPIVGFLGIGAMVLVLIWAFSRGHSVVERPAKSGRPTDYGLLMPIATPSDYIQGEMLRRRLVDSGIQATLATTNDGPRILIWPGDADQAEAILSRGH